MSSRGGACEPVDGVSFPGRASYILISPSRTAAQGDHVKKLLTTLIAAAGLAAVLAIPVEAQQQCPPGQTGNLPYCQTLPPPAACAKFTAKLSLARATITRFNRRLSVLAPITGLASGEANVELHAAGLKTRFNTAVDSANRRIRFNHLIARSQANLGTGIITMSYPGDADTRPQVVRLRAAAVQARLRAARPAITAAGHLVAGGIVTLRAQGVVRVQLEYVSRLTGETTTLEFKVPIDNGRYNLDVQLPPAVLAQIAARCGSLHSYTLFTGYLPARVRGEMQSYQVLGPQ